ncbi:hypothetical protein [Pedobacter duraquae]|uniref:Uncharacterized protein n=1 Tax=Pedobacter duraquae TaxID=425511 RepID=A0A4R6IFA8_9SPHI|nr:hypothetical protein [Pedobacter duraquae]TDO20694.1 hypothetical protein CLV32_3327 [Pedobacter duraquae]
MKSITRGLFIFYSRLIIPSLGLSILLSLLMMGSIGFLAGVGISYIVFSLALHYYIYEIKNTEEYYFYHNLGLSRFWLWVNTIGVSLFIGLLLTI